MTIGFLDLVVTAVLHAQGRIVEMNPLMRTFIQQSEWMFVLVKGSTLILAWVVMARYAKHNPQFVSKVCLFGSAAYMMIWTVWFARGS